MSAPRTLSADAAEGVMPADTMAGFEIVRVLSEIEASDILRRVEREELTHFLLDDKQADSRNARFDWNERGRRSGPVSVLAVETKPGTIACIFFIGANWRNSITADVVWAEELRRPRSRKA